MKIKGTTILITVSIILMGYYQNAYSACQDDYNGCCYECNNNDEFEKNCEFVKRIHTISGDPNSNIAYNQCMDTYVNECIGICSNSLNECKDNNDDSKFGCFIQTIK